MKIQYKVRNFRLKAEIRWSLKRRGEFRWSLRRGRRDPLVTQADLSCVFSARRTTSQKGSPPQKKDMCELCSDCIPTTHNHRCRRIKILIVLYLRVFLCLSSGAICDTIHLYSINRKSLDECTVWLSSFLNKLLTPFRLFNAKIWFICESLYL